MDLIPLGDYALLTLLLLGALASFAWGLERVRRRVWRGRPLAGSLRERIHWRSLAWRGLATARVFDRPAAGSAHALVFFGSLVLIAGHALHPLAMAGLPLYEGVFGHWFMGVAREVAGLAVVLGVVFFLVRRLRGRGRIAATGARRGFAPMEFLLLAALAAGFVTESTRIVADPGLHGGEFLGTRLAALWEPGDAAAARFRFAWWIHGVIGLGFLASIAHTPLAHLVLAPLNWGLAPRRRGITLDPIDFTALENADAEATPTLGVSRLADFGRDRLLEFETCVWCGRCHEVCPAAQTGKALSPKRVVTTLALRLAEDGGGDTDVIEAVGLEPIFDCVTCAACIEVCPVGVHPPEALLEMRRHLALERGELPAPLATASRSMEQRGHPFAGSSQSPDAWRGDLDVPRFEPGKTEYLLWLGCATRYDERAQGVARALVRILGRAGVSFGVLEHSRCTGDPAKQIGNELLFAELAGQNVDQLNGLGVHKLITTCAHCFNAFTRYYPELGGSWEVVPHAVLIDRLLAEGKLAIPDAEREAITFHDPCYLSRHNDVEDEARNVLGRVGRVVEMPRNRKQSFCCGAGGGAYWGGEGGTARIGDVRAAEALATGSTTIATACPFCLLMLTAGVGQQGGEARVLDVAEIVAEKLGI
jgi:Fe-S oxidoreductase/nitrate reductase gamma subunit